jgi:hypothetical protein
LLCCCCSCQPAHPADCDAACRTILGKMCTCADPTNGCVAVPDMLLCWDSPVTGVGFSGETSSGNPVETVQILFVRKATTPGPLGHARSAVSD